MKDIIFLVIKGFIIGIGKIIPGVSGAVMALSLGVYERSVELISNIFKIRLRDLYFIISLGFGFVLSVVLFSNVIVKMLDSYYLPTILFFIGLIIGSIKLDKDIIKNRKNMLIFSSVLLLITMLSFIDVEKTSDSSFFMLFIMGVIEAVSMIVPGLSGTALLMMFGYYEVVLSAFSSVDVNVLFPFVVGIIVGGIIISKVINYLFKNYKEKTNIVISALSVSSVLILFIQTLENIYSFGNIIFSLLLLVVGYNLGKIMEK